MTFDVAQITPDIIISTQVWTNICGISSKKQYVPEDSAGNLPDFPCCHLFP